ncbi:lytic murein transglycosylase [Mesorhizobium helmanticense]|uniref:Lytic murein transglycosylase n=1 Tax=Mesorhizobium helmanticense TaxID=1776423 RepID=A0A2T4IYJ3_9HYPH|nr:lytic murein transglycosylase [Mesorhizobium helmanticense]
MMARGTPLCPAGHLPLKGGDRMSLRLSPIFYVAGKAPSSKLPISPLEGEMPGRAEGGAWARPLQSAQRP